jgi:hypothetical protein
VSLIIGPNRQFQTEFRRDLLGGLMVLKHQGMVAEKPLSNEPLYQRLTSKESAATKPVELTFIPYYAWANRGPDQMQVWIPYRQAKR